MKLKIYQASPSGYDSRGSMTSLASSPIYIVAENINQAIRIWDNQNIGCIGSIVELGDAILEVATID